MLYFPYFVTIYIYIYIYICLYSFRELIVPYRQHGPVPYAKEGVRTSNYGTQRERVD